ncbi:MAG: DUF4282 domain-containing protein [Rubripirellula sp.]
MSEQESGWSLKHRDNIEHGPFELEDLITAARTGNIATDTMLRHSKHTRNQWVIATRVANIAQALSQTVPTSKTRQTPTSHNTTSSAASNNPVSETTPAHQAKNQDAAAQNSSPPPKSIFRRTRSSSANPPNTPTTKLPEPTAEPEVTENQKSADGVSEQRDLSIRNWQEDNLLVPRTLPDAFFAFFDFKFRFFITPWIVKLLWFIGITAAIVTAVRLGYDNLFSPELDTEVAAEQGVKNWQFEPLGGKPLLSFPAARYFFYALVIFCSTLLLRVACEVSIVMFRIAGSLAEIKVILKEKKL